MSKTIPASIRRNHFRIGKVRVRQALAAFRAGKRPAARWFYLAAGGWFRKAGVEHLARRAEAIGLKVVALQRALGEPVGPARRFPDGTVPTGRMVYLKGRRA